MRGYYHAMSEKKEREGCLKTSLVPRNLMIECHTALPYVLNWDKVVWMPICPYHPLHYELRYI